MRRKVTFTIVTDDNDQFNAFVEHCDEIAYSMFDETSYEVDNA